MEQNKYLNNLTQPKYNKYSIKMNNTAADCIFTTDINTTYATKKIKKDKNWKRLWHVQLKKSTIFTNSLDTCNIQQQLLTVYSD